MCFVANVFNLSRFSQYEYIEDICFARCDLATHLLANLKPGVVNCHNKNPLCCLQLAAAFFSDALGLVISVSVKIKNVNLASALVFG